MRYCDKELLKILNCKISTLEITDHQIEASTIVQILEKSGLLLQRIKLASTRSILEESSLLETLKSFCPNITYLTIWGIKFSTQLVELIGNLKKLQFFTLRCKDKIKQEEERERRVRQFAEILPLTLQYLDLRLNTWLEPYIDILLNHCNAPLDTLLIDDSQGHENTTQVLIEFCIRNRAFKYLSGDLSPNTEKELKKYIKFIPDGYDIEF
ncbi:hypothetical protein F8M41_006625 [Gigaspora margarita]|uniref:Uncharacterized protein n=1 Tax=Gigaspora margarita TaxID=4874 RepID=A0A8H4A5Y5_GIGMA|nr:hypothetical protein F8M41_006625 [Gigaspora margarita]